MNELGEKKDVKKKYTEIFYRDIYIYIYIYTHDSESFKFFLGCLALNIEAVWEIYVLPRLCHSLPDEGLDAVYDIGHRFCKGFQVLCVGDHWTRGNIGDGFQVERKLRQGHCCEVEVEAAAAAAAAAASSEREAAADGREFT